MTDDAHPAGIPDDLQSLSYEPLTPVAFLDRAAAAHGDRVGRRRRRPAR